MNLTGVVCIWKQHKYEELPRSMEHDLPYANTACGVQEWINVTYKLKAAPTVTPSHTGLYSGAMVDPVPRLL
jgi:hypothetical protein